jgi:hypothetical protein
MDLSPVAKSEKNERELKYLIAELLESDNTGPPSVAVVKAFDRLVKKGFARRKYNYYGSFC